MSSPYKYIVNCTTVYGSTVDKIRSRETERILGLSLDLKKISLRFFLAHWIFEVIVATSSSSSTVYTLNLKGGIRCIVGTIDSSNTIGCHTETGENCHT
jgi:hypothetical protein